MSTLRRAASLGPYRAVRSRLKRCTDVVVACCGLLVLSPVLAVVALAVLITMGRPVLFVQVRPGLGARSFKMYKFRTMRVVRGPCDAASDSARLTALGRMLRATSIDELPELWNVLRGDMSLVGPRPLLVRYLPYFDQSERDRFLVRPGITGLAQVRGRNTASWTVRFSEDLAYVANWSVMLDLSLILRTVVAAVSRRDVVVDPQSTMRNLDEERSGEVSIVPLTEDQCGVFADLLRRAYDQRQFPGSPIYCRGYPAALAANVRAGDLLLGLHHFGRVVAVMQLRWIDGSVHINHVAVAPEDQGWGFGELLLRHVHEYAGDATVTLHVDSRNARAISFYERHGYRCRRQTPMALCAFGHPECGTSAVGLSAETQGTLQSHGFCRIQGPGMSTAATLFCDAAVALSNDASPQDVSAIVAWLKSGTIKLKRELVSADLLIKEEWETLELYRECRMASMRVSSDKQVCA